jgi:hypothetical protein
MINHNTVKLKISEIQSLESTQTRVRTNLEKVEEYKELIASKITLPPPVIFQQGKNNYVGDGIHRILAQKALGFDEIEVIVKEGDKRDALLYSITENAKHGLQRTSGDKKKAIQILLDDEEWGEWSNVVIAKKAGVSHQYVAKISKELSTSRKLCKGKDGKIRDISNIGRKSSNENIALDPEEVSNDSLATVDEEEDRLNYGEESPDNPPKEIHTKLSPKQEELEQITKHFQINANELTKSTNSILVRIHDLHSDTKKEIGNTLQNIMYDLNGLARRCKENSYVD